MKRPSSCEQQRSSAEAGAMLYITQSTWRLQRRWRERKRSKRSEGEQATAPVTPAGGDESEAFLRAAELSSALY